MNAKSILICDDEPELAEEMADFLRSMGWSTRTANSGAEAIRLLETGPVPDVLMTDLRMPGMTGEALIAHVRQLPPSGRPRHIIVVTGHVAETMTTDEFDSDRLFVKPIDPDALIGELNRMADTSPVAAGSDEAS